MEQQQWTNNPYSSPSSTQRQAPHSLATPQRDNHQHPQHQHQYDHQPKLHAQTQSPRKIQHTLPSSPAKHDAYDSLNLPRLARSASLSLSSPADAPRQSSTMDYPGDGDGDRLMEDADLYNKHKYAQSSSRPPSQRNSTHFLPTQQDDLSASSAARRYSPMNTSPTSPYVTSPNALGPSYTPQQQRQSSRQQSPTRQASYNTASQNNNNNNNYYSSPTASRSQHVQQLPPLQAAMSPDGYYPQSASAQLNAAFARETRSPRGPQTPSRQEPAQEVPLPQFAKCTDVADLQPCVNAQPPFRRANPEGGFISPLQALTTQLPSTYRICNPSFQYESSRNPRRVLTKPSKGSKNDGYDNEDSDYILYVNDILGSEETNHKNRYLILDVLGQGTFGQVVKCQNLKTQEVVAVKVVKNRTAYFNQSMMEVSVLDLVSYPQKNMSKSIR